MLGAKCLRPSYLGNEKNAHSTPMRSCCSPGGFANDSESVTKRKSFCHLFYFSLTFKYLILSMFLFIVSYISLGISEVVIKINMNSMMLIGNVNCFCCSDIFGICCSNNAKMNAIIRLNNILNIWNFTRFCSFCWVCIIVLHECVWIFRTEMCWLKYASIMFCANRPNVWIINFLRWERLSFSSIVIGNLKPSILAFPAKTRVGLSCYGLQ